MKVIYTKGGGQKPTHNYAPSCSNLNALSRFVVQIYVRYAEMLSPLILRPQGHFRDSPSFLHLHPEHLITSLDTFCPNPVSPGLELAHNMHMLVPDNKLLFELDRIAPYEKPIVVAVNALLKAAASRNKRPVDEVDDADTDKRLSKKVKD